VGTFAAGTSRGFSNEVQSIASSWELAVVFAARSANHCGTAQFNNAFVAAAIVQPQAVIRRAQYMYAATTNTRLGLPAGTTVVQFEVTVDPVAGLSQCAVRTYFTGGQPLVTGLGVADDLQSLMIFAD